MLYGISHMTKIKYPEAGKNGIPMHQSFDLGEIKMAWHTYDGECIVFWTRDGKYQGVISSLKLIDFLSGELE